MGKNIIIVGKGPSTRFIPVNSKYNIACFNNATINCELIDYWFCHDQDNVDLIKPKEWLKIKNAIIPYFPQKAYPGGFSKDFTYKSWSNLIHQHNPDCHIHPVALGVHDMNNLKYPKDIPHMGETYSVLQTAATWLGMHNKVSNLITCGLDPQGGYHPMFQTMKKDNKGNVIPTTNGNKIWTKAAAATTHQKFHQIARHYNYNILRLEDDGTVNDIL